MRGKLKAIEQQEGRPIKQVLIDDFNLLGSQVALAEKYEVNQSTVAYWLMKLGLQTKTILVDVQEGS